MSKTESFDEASKNPEEIEDNFDKELDQLDLDD